MKPVRQLVTFYIGEDLFGVPVEWVQEVKDACLVETVPLGPHFLHGLINLRGQIATALNLSSLFEMGREAKGSICVICQLDDNLVSLVVEGIGDVLDVSEELLEEPPVNLPEKVRSYLQSVYKDKNQLVSIINMEALAQELNLSADNLFRDIA